MRLSTTTIKEDLAWLLEKKGTFSDSSITRTRKPDVYNSADYPNIALLSPRTHAEQPYNERKVIFTDNAAYVRVKLAEGWNSMLKRHYDERIAIDKGPVHKDNSWVRKIVEHIYAKIRKQRRKY